MKVGNHELLKHWLNLNNEELVNEKLLCRVYSLLYLNHWYRRQIDNDEGRNLSEWAYIGHGSPAVSLGRIANILTVTSLKVDVRDKGKWLDMEGDSCYSDRNMLVVK